MSSSSPTSTLRLYASLAVYAAAVFLPGALAVLSQVPPSAKTTRKWRLNVMILSSVMTEMPQIFLLLKLFIIIFASGAGIFDAYPAGHSGSWCFCLGSIAHALYYLDVAVCLGIWALFLQSYFARFIVEENTKQYRALDSNDPPGFFHLGFWFRLLNPFWSARGVLVHPDICYATNEELKASDNPAAELYLSLDVHMHPSYPRNRPVLIYIHGGSWSTGDKTITPPFVSYMALKRWVVVSVNYRLYPHSKYPTHLIDVKRAIRWVRQHIARYGGDPSFIAISGNAAGGHLASMAALTPNDPLYQPGFEDVDTTVQACVLTNAVVDLTNHKRFWRYRFQEWFSQYIAGFGKNGYAAHEEFLKASSPVLLLKQIEALRRKSAGVTAQVTESHEPAHGEGLKEARIKAEAPVVAAAEVAGEEEAGKKPRAMTGAEELPPFLIFHGRADHLVPFRSVRDFVQSFKKVSKSPICYIEFPCANHMFDILSSPRSHYMAYGIDRFLGRMYERHGTKPALQVPLRRKPTLRALNEGR
ncbi:Alpha/Beta hydrolase protein [Fimicolochytrium jonesii]|uniref:Alpha/Beta hydrolase protein n=1 Tax=Fimicolochytrium jonesii TaxID=1396493 RepID=UPI0022FE440E|nr:Alpha/Beta hydrolase protein [Fimicolochytrium jonesii]KAI8824871.1 Alpha/Beta hydrolase protein [Fimicolochytrium jonesii]